MHTTAQIRSKVMNTANFEKDYGFEEDAKENPEIIDAIFEESKEASPTIIETIQEAIPIRVLL